MRDWFYTKAKFFKQAAFFVSGAAVAASTATTIVDSTTSWISNLIAIVGCSVYSSFDNIETAHSITVREEKIQQRVKKLAMEDYQEGEPTVLLEEILENISSLDMKVDDVMAAIKKTAEEFKKSLAQKYARTNWIAQMITSIVTGAINISANLEENPEDRENLLTPKNILNITLVPLCILIWQCWWPYRTAKNLQEMAEKTENLERALSQASKSLAFRTKVCRLFWERKERITVELRECEQEITGIRDQITQDRLERRSVISRIEQGAASELTLETGLNTRIETNEQKLKLLEERRSILNEEFKHFNEKEVDFVRLQTDLADELRGVLDDDAEIHRLRGL